MKTKSKEQKKAIAADVFGRYPKAQKVAVTSDGMAFITDENEIAVKNHANKNRYGKELTISHFRREEMDSDKSDKPKTAKELIAEIEAANTVEAVEAILKAENEGEKRKTVIEAAEKRINELKEAE